MQRGAPAPVIAGIRPDGWSFWRRLAAAFDDRAQLIAVSIFPRLIRGQVAPCRGAYGADSPLTVRGGFIHHHGRD